VGRTFDVLFERAGRYPGQLVGRTPYLHAVQAFVPADLIGKIRPVLVTERSANSLFGRLARAPADANEPCLLETGA
jgi:tRNA-2-methylthio-N6-dimethylallyladenosine synthase